MNRAIGRFHAERAWGFLFMFMGLPVKGEPMTIQMIANKIIKEIKARLEAAKKYLYH